MIKELKDCKVGDLVQIWCIGPRAWDDEIVKIIEHDKHFLNIVQYRSGRTARFIASTPCKLISF